MRLTRTLKIILGILAAILVLVAVALWGLAHGWATKPAERLASNLMERPVTMDELRIYVLSRTPYAQVDGLKVANPDWVEKSGDDAGNMVDLGKGEVAIRVLPLLKGEVRLARLVLENGNVDLLRELNGRANWAIGSGKTTSDTAPLTLPVVERFVVNNSRIRLADAMSKIGFEGQFSTQEGSEKTGQPFELSGKGMLNAQPFSLHLTGGAIANVLENKSYPFNLEVRHGATKITAKGQFAKALDLSDFTAAMTLEGRNLADLYYLTGLALPKTRAYSLKGDLSRNGMVFKLANLQGKLGGSDLSGDLQVDTGRERPLLTAELRSRLLDPADAGVIFGGSAESKYLLPDSALEVRRLRGMDAKVSYEAEAINVDSLPLKQVSLMLTLEDGKLSLSPLAVTLPQGLVSGSLVIDGRPEVPDITMDMRLTGAKLEDFAAQAGQTNAVSGKVMARVQLAGKGNSIHAAAAAGNGRATVVVPGGEIRQAFGELLGVNAARGLGLLLSGNQQQMAVRCGIASFEAKDGVLRAEHLVLDTETVVTTGGGQIDLRDESMDLTLQGKPKEARLLRLVVPIQIGGHLKDPELGVGVVPLSAQAGVATALGVVLTPLAAILPFVDVGLAEDANCGALMQEGKAAGVKGVK